MADDIPSLPARYEHLKDEFKGRLIPNHDLIDSVKKAYNNMRIGKGIRFLPVYGESGSGKSCAARELSTHLPESKTITLPKEAINDSEILNAIIKDSQLGDEELLIFIVDEYEEQVAQKENIPSRFVESLSLLDRNITLVKKPILFIWLTNSKDFQKSLVNATSRNTHILRESQFQLVGPAKSEWPDIIEETFNYHNNLNNRPNEPTKHLSDYLIINQQLVNISNQKPTLGKALEAVGDILGENIPNLQNLSEYQVLMLWPVTDAYRKERVISFVDFPSGCQLEWKSWYKHLSDKEKNNLENVLIQYNRARLYFDVRLIPINVADIHKLCLNLDDDNYKLAGSYLEQFEKTHFYSILTNQWNPGGYSSVGERDQSIRATDATKWYESITQQPTKLGRRLARILTELGYKAEYEKKLSSPHGDLRADVFVERNSHNKNKVIIEMKSYSTQNTRPSSIAKAIRTTLKRHAVFAGFIEGE